MTGPPCCVGLILATSSRKIVLSNNDNNNLPAAERFQLYAVTTAFPQALAASMGFSWQATDQLGVYNLILGKLTIIVIVTKQIPKAPHNLPWNLLSQEPEHVRYALNLDPLPPELRKHFENLNW